MSTFAARAGRFAALTARRFDVLVIGGGITGCGIARDAALRGLSTALVEKGDFASGTSSRSSRLVHGGVRYLEHGHLHLVFESSAERRRLLRLAPHLVRPLPFTWPVYRGARIPRWKLGAGLMLYDALALFQNVGKHERLSRADVLRAEPALRDADLLGGARYFDAATNDARLTLANALSAQRAGAVAVNHAAATSLLLEAGQVAGATVRDSLTGAAATVHARVVVNATGPWSDGVRGLEPAGGRAQSETGLRGSKGAHIAVPRERVGNNAALTLLHPADGRVFFVLPSEGNTIVGTTDTYTSASPDSVRASRDDVRYLLESANAFFPRALLGERDVVSAWAGIRPLLPSGADTPGGATREHAVSVDERGLVSITGGKLTTYRVMARDVMHAVLERLRQPRGPDATKTAPLFGGQFTSLDDLIAEAARVTNDEPLAARLATTFGTEWRTVWSEIATGDGRSRLTDDLPYTLGELRYSAAHEMAATLGDLLVRRTHLSFQAPDHGARVAERAARAVAAALGWDTAAVAAAVRDYEREIESMFAVDSVSE